MTTTRTVLIENAPADHPGEHRVIVFETDNRGHLWVDDIREGPLPALRRWFLRNYDGRIGVHHTDEVAAPATAFRKAVELHAAS